MLSKKQKSQKKIVENGIEYFTVDGLDAVKKEMLRLLSIINEITISNNISYWIDGGSLIGVLRHDGFIPWDDDLDISMLKQDYYRLIEKLTEYAKTHDDAYLFYESPQEYHSCNYFASRTLFTRTQGTSMVVPVKVDIRPLNCIDNSEVSISENMKLRDIANRLIFGRSYGYSIEYPEDAESIKSFFCDYNNKYGFEDPTKKDICFTYPYYEFTSKFDVHYDDLFPLKKHKFEDIEVPIPNNYHYMLSNLYGNYMEMPPIENRAPVACKVYKKELSLSLYKKYISITFGLHKGGLFCKLQNNFLMMRIIGVADYIKSRFGESKVN